MPFPTLLPKAKGEKLALRSPVELGRTATLEQQTQAETGQEEPLPSSLTSSLQPSSALAPGPHRQPVPFPEELQQSPQAPGIRQPSVRSQ